MRRALAFLAATALAAPAGGQETPGYLVSPDWVQANLDNPSVVILHVDGRPEGFSEGHLPGARFLDLDDLVWPGDPEVGTEMRTPAEIEEAFEAAGVSDGVRIVVYGANPLAAARAWMTLDVMGLGEQASFMDGGLGAWKEDGRPLSTGEAAPPPRGSLTLHPRDGVVVDSDWILARLDDPALTLIDARPDDEYTGADGGMNGRVHAGHIPGAFQIYWEELVESRPVHRAHPIEELRALFAASGAGEGSTVAVYCMVGLRASYMYLTARRLGYDVKFYDGSWLDWGSKDLPFVGGPSRR